ncbi:MAG TPA: hypothetical protein VGE05_01725 [Novosphingobium sp.]
METTDIGDTPSSPWTAAQRPLRQSARPKLAALGVRPQRVHWSIALLTICTAASILTGSYRGKPSQSRDLEPVVIATAMR